MSITTINKNNIDALALGATLLGSGGGGDPLYQLAMAHHQLDQYGPVSLINVHDLQDEDLIVPLAFMGAPLAAIEKLPSGKEFPALLAMIEKVANKKIKALMPGEIGGANALTPLLIAGIMKLPIVNGDLLGRAFPTIDISTAALNNISHNPIFLADAMGSIAVLETSSLKASETVARAITVAMGSIAAVALYLMTGKQARNNGIITGSIEQAIKLGQAIINAQQMNQDPIAALIAATEGIVLGFGTITDINQVIKDGFLQGSVRINSINQELILYYQNEHLIAQKNGKVVCSTPDIIIPVDTQNGTPITSESLAYGLRVTVIAIPAPKLWQTAKGLAMVGPRVFGYDFDYQPCTFTKDSL